MNLRILLTLVFALSSQGVYAANLPGIPQFIDEMVQHYHFKRNELERVFDYAEYRSDVINAITMPATVKPWTEYRAGFMQQVRIDGGVEFWKKYANTLSRAERQFGVPQEIIVAVIGVETLYGRRAGTYRALDALTTLAFEYPQRAAFFRNELAEYLILARDQQFNLLDIKSSYAGALGIPQFMPSSYRKYALDYNGNGKVDLLNEPEDAIGSVANYLKNYGWKQGEPVAQLARLDDGYAFPDGGVSRSLESWAAVGVEPVNPLPSAMPPARLLDFTLDTGKQYWLVYDNFKVITLYNNSNFYAMSVFQLAESLRSAYSRS